MSQLQLFDLYASLPDEFQSADKVQTLENHAIAIEAHAKTTVQSILAVGRELNAARAVFGENDTAFGKWRNNRLPWLHKRTALNFMQSDSKFGNKDLRNNFALDKIAPTVLYELAAPSTPDDVVEQVLRDAETGEVFTVKDVKRLKAQAKELKAKTESQGNEIQQWQSSLKDLKEKVDQKAEALAVERLESAKKEYQETVAKLQKDKDSLESQIQKTKENHKKALDDFKQNPDPVTKAKIEELKKAQKKMQSDLEKTQFRLENMKGTEQEIIAVSFEVDRFFKHFEDLMKDHADVFCAMSSPYLPDSSLAKLETLASSFKSWAETIRKSVFNARSAKANPAGASSAIQAFDVDYIEV